MGLPANARKHIVRHLLYAIDEALVEQPAKRDDFDFFLGALRSTEAIRHFLQAGKWTWERSRHRRGKRGLLDILDVVTSPPRIPKRSTADGIWYTRRRAFQALLDF